MVHPSASPLGALQRCTQKMIRIYRTGGSTPALRQMPEVPEDCMLHMIHMIHISSSPSVVWLNCPSSSFENGHSNDFRFEWEKLHSN